MALRRAYAWLIKSLVVQACLAFLDHGLDLGKIVERHRHGGVIANAGS